MTSNSNDIAIVGMSCRLPGANSTAEFWENLRNGIESITFFSEEELEESGVDRKLLDNPRYVRAAGILDDVEGFDPLLFGYSPREAASIDPQQRLFLECAWEALEAAGCNPDTYPGLIAVFGGARTSDYLIQNICANPATRQSLSKLDMELGNDIDYLATRVSYKLNLKAPSFTIQTACSTSLVAVAMACDSLLSGQSDVAIAGGVSISLPQKKGYHYVEGSIFSPDGHCRAFDADARGVVFSNGAGLVAMKRLDDALSDGDCIHAVIKGYALNNDGADKVGFTAPSVEGQAQVIADALAMSGVPADSISYVEAHGTGTELGDPIEIAALTQAFRLQTQKNGFCAIGSVKTNIGHTFVTAGIASLIKTVLALSYRAIPPSLNFQKPNPRAGLDESPFYVASKLTPWEDQGRPLRAGVSSFGVGGTNAHVILEEPPTLSPSSESRPNNLFVLSARTDSALESATGSLLSHLKSRPDLNPADSAYTLQVGRRALNSRRMFVCRNCEQAIELLGRPETLQSGTPESEDCRVAFLFSGQGAQYVNMGRELYDNEHLFREHVDRCSEMLRPHLGLDLRDALYPQEETPEASNTLAQTALTQPALFVVEFALAELLMNWGIQPQAMIGHSIGEYAAACLSGVFSLEQALELVTQRGRLMQGMPAGSMLAVFSSSTDVEQLLKSGKQAGALSLAAMNAPSLCVVSGPTPAVDQFESELAGMDVACRRLHTSHAFHSPMMEPILEPFANVVREMELHEPRIPFVSNVTGTWIRPEEATDPSFWARHIRQAVRFSEGLQELCRKSRWHLLELGPGRTLCSLVTQHTDIGNLGRVLPSLSHPREREPDQAFLLTTLGKLWLAGVEVDWAGFHSGEQRRRTQLPTYPFEHQRCWLDAVTPFETGASLTGHDDRRRSSINDWLYTPSWKRTLAPGNRTSIGSGQEEQLWLVFLDDGGIGAGLLELPPMQNLQIVTVRPGDQFESCGNRQYILNPETAGEYETLIRALQEEGFVPDRILHLWALGNENRASSGVERFHQSQNLGFFSLLSLAGALDKSGITGSVEIDIVTSRLFQVTDRRDLISIEDATISAACRGIPQEYANLVCRNIDIGGLNPEPSVVKDLFHELAYGSADSTVAYRGNMRWTPLYDPLGSVEEMPERNLLRPGGTYLITGGLGHIGLTIAKCLAQQTHGNMLLMTRTGLPPRSEWQQLVEEQAEDNALRDKILAVQDIERAAAGVTLLKADIADRQQMAAAVEEALHQFGAINGVVHASGLFASAPVRETDGAFCNVMFRPKVEGLFVLSQVFQKVPLDFCILTSSLSSLLGGLGYAGYSASNLFMDAFAASVNEDNDTPWITVNWDEWHTPDADEHGTDEEKKRNSLAIRPDEAAEVLLKILTRDIGTQIVVSTSSLQDRLDRWLGASLHGSAVQHDAPVSSYSPRPALSSVYVEPGNPTEKAIANIWREMLGIDKVGVHDNFFELGGHSLLATQVVARLREAFSIELPVASLFENPTVDSLGKTIDERGGSDETSLLEESKRRGAERKKRRNMKTARKKGKTTR